MHMYYMYTCMYNVYLLLYMYIVDMVDKPVVTDNIWSLLGCGTIAIRGLEWAWNKVELN